MPVVIISLDRLPNNIGTIELKKCDRNFQARGKIITTLISFTQEVQSSSHFIVSREVHANSQVRLLIDDITIKQISSGSILYHNS